MRFEKNRWILLLLSVLMVLLVFAACGSKESTATSAQSSTAGVMSTTAPSSTSPLDSGAAPALTTTPATSARPAETTPFTSVPTVPQSTPAHSTEKTPITTPQVPQTTAAPIVTEAQKPAIGNPSAIGYPSVEGDTLPILSIITEDGAEIVSKEEYLNAAISVSGTTDDALYGFTDRTSEVRCRGNYTFTGTEKKSYRLKFTEKINLFNQGYGPAKSWVLLANHCDQSFLRNHIAFSVARELSHISYCTSSSFVKLYINGEYEGIYQVAEQHQVNRYRVNIDEDPEAVDTDYLIERDNYAADSGDEGVAYFRINRTKYRIHSDYLSEEKCKFVQDYYQKAHDAIKGGKIAEVSRYIDVDSMIDTMILQAFVKNTDVGYSSFFMVKKAGGKIYFTCPWDFDLSQGNDDRLDSGSPEGLYIGAKSGMMQEHEWFYLLMNEQWFCNRLLARWNEVKEKIYGVAISEAQRILACFEDDMASNFDVWKIFGEKINQEPRDVRMLKSYNAHVKHLIKWIESRYSYLDGLFNSEELYNQGGYESSGGWWPGGWW